MSYDIEFRFERALNPESLTSLRATHLAIGEAIQDAVNAGCEPENDPAIILLARHLGRIANGEDVQIRDATDIDLRERCAAMVEQIKNSDRLVTLARRGFAYDEHAKTVFHAEARKALQQLAPNLGLNRSDYDLRTNRGGIAVSGETIFHSDSIYLQVSTSSMMANGEILYRRCSSRSDFYGGPNYFADISALRSPEQFAKQIEGDLNLCDKTHSIPARSSIGLLPKVALK